MSSWGPYAQGFATAAALLQLATAALLARQHQANPHWGLNWAALAMLGGSLANLIHPALPPLAAGSQPAGLQLAAILTMGTFGFGALGALLVAMRMYLGLPGGRSALLFALYTTVSLVTTVLANAMGNPLVGELIAVFTMGYCAWIAARGARRERGVGHGLISFSLLFQPVTVLGLMLWRIDPQTVWHLSAVPFTMVGVALIHISARRMQQRSQADESRFKTLFDEAPVPLMFRLKQGGVVALNQAWVKATGYTLEDTRPPERWWAMVYPDPQYREHVRALWMSKLDALGKDHEALAPVEARMLCKDGSVRTMVVGATEVEGGAIISFLDISAYRDAQARLEQLNTELESRVLARTLELQDRNSELSDLVTALNTAKDRISKSEQRLQYVLDATGEGIWDWSVTSGQLVNNARWADILGRSRGSLEHTLAAFEEHLPEDSRRVVTRELQASLQSGKPYRAEYPLRRADGRLIWVQDRGVVVERDVRGQPMRMVGSIADVTERKETELELAEANARLAQSNEALTLAMAQLKRTQNELIRSEKLASLGSLVAGVAHELNTPLGNALVAATTMSAFQKTLEHDLATGLRRSTLDAYRRDMLEAAAMIERNLHRAAELLGSFKQIAVDQASDKRRPFALSALLHEVAFTMQPSLRAHSVTIAVDCPRDMTLDSYPGALSQVLINMVNNCIVHAFAPGAGGSIVIAAREDLPHGALVTLTDNGAGIPPSVIGKVFDPFFTTRLGQGGSGLGLNIAYNIVTGVLGGLVHVESAPGQGTRFLLRIPLQAPSTPPAALPAAPSLPAPPGQPSPATP